MPPLLSSLFLSLAHIHLRDWVVCIPKSIRPLQVFNTIVRPVGVLVVNPIVLSPVVLQERFCYDPMHGLGVVAVPTI